MLASPTFRRWRVVTGPSVGSSLTMSAVGASAERARSRGSMRWSAANATNASTITRVHWPAPSARLVLLTDDLPSHDTPDDTVRPTAFLFSARAKIHRPGIFNSPSTHCLHKELTAPGNARVCGKNLR